jgi:hypothetical protein
MKKTELNVLITGTTGMVGEGVLQECLNHPAVKTVLLVNRSSTGITHPKLREIIHADFLDFSAIESALTNLDACFFCLGVSSVGMKEAPYFQLTHTLTLHVASTLARLNPAMTFCYVSGAGTDSSEKGRSMWARVKGKTENDLLKLPFKNVFLFRPGFIKPTPGLNNTHRFYTYINWMFPIGKILAPNMFCTLRELGISMIEVAMSGDTQQILASNDYRRLVKRNQTS